VAVHPDGASFLTVSDDGTLRAWSLDSRAELAASRHFSFPGYEVHDGLAFDTDGTLIRGNIIGSNVWLWRPETGQEIRLARALGREVDRLSLSPGGQMFIAASNLWSSTTGFKLERWQSWNHKGYSGPFSTDGNQIIDLEYGTVYIHDAATGDVLASHRLDAEVVDLHVVVDRPWVMMRASEDTNYIVWDYATDTIIAEFPSPDVPQSPAFLAVGHDLAFSQSAELINLSTGSTIAQLDIQKYFQTAAFSPNDQWLAVFNNQYELSIWDVATLTRHENIQSPFERLIRLTFSPTGETLYGVGESGAIYRWNIQ
jgi:WD40 repeat protein